MAIGLDQKELDSAFFQESAASLERHHLVSEATLIHDYELKGFNHTQAEAMADLGMKLMAASSAILTVIYQNNLRVASQLEQGGFHQT